MLKAQSLILSICLLCHGQIIHANALSNTQNDTQATGGAVSNYVKKVTPEMLYSYIDFNFNSTQGASFNRFQGNSNLYTVGGDHFSLGSSVKAGLYYFRVDTSVSSQFLLSPGSMMLSDQLIKNNTIFSHVLKTFTPQIMVDLSGGYGFNEMNTVTQIAPGTSGALVSQSHNNNNNWFVSMNGFYSKPWNKFLFKANLGVLYSQVNTSNYNYVFPASEVLVSVQPLVNRATLLIENTEAGYNINSKLMAFINGSLLQVVQFSNSRPILDASTIINGSLPQLNMDKNGFRLGGGFSYTNKNVSIRIEEKYYNAGGTFQSYQTLAGLEYQFG